MRISALYNLAAIEVGPIYHLEYVFQMSCGTIISIHVCVYIYIYGCVCVGLCVCSWIGSQGEDLISSIFEAVLEYPEDHSLFTLVQRAVLVKTCMTRREG